MKKEAIAALVILFIIVTGIFIFFNSSKTFEKAECKSDGDCVLQRTTCCPCSMGGKEVCMAKTNVSAFAEEIKNCPMDLICPALYSCPEKTTCACIGGKCV